MKRGEQVWYRGYLIGQRDYPVAHPRWPEVDYTWVHPDYDGAMDGNDNRAGFGPSLEAVKRQVDANIEEQSDD